MRFYGSFFDTQGAGNLPIGSGGDQELKHFGFAGRELSQRRGGGPRRFGRAIHENGQYAPRRPYGPLADGHDRLFYLLRRLLAPLELLRRPEVSYEALSELTGVPGWAVPGAVDERLPGEVRTQVEVRAKYAGYIERQSAEIERARRHEELPLPQDLDYPAMSGLSHEVRQQLALVRPATLGQAGRVPGVTPAAVQILLVHLKKRGARAARA